MKIPFLFVAVFTFIAWLQYELKKTSRVSKKHTDEFWENESNANISRKKDISNLDYIMLNTDMLPIADHNDSTINSYRDRILDLSDKKIINLSSYNNTQLKLKYGAANFPFLTEYDNNYMILVSILHKWGERLYQNKDINKAVLVLEYAISCSSDVRNTYRLLSKIYKEQDKLKQLTSLIHTLSKSKVQHKDSLIEELNKLKDS